MLCASDTVLIEFFDNAVTLMNNTLIFISLNQTPGPSFASEDVYGFISLAAQTREAKARRERCLAALLRSRGSRLLRFV